MKKKSLGNLLQQKRV